MSLDKIIGQAPQNIEKKVRAGAKALRAAVAASALTLASVGSSAGTVTGENPLGLLEYDPNNPQQYGLNIGGKVNGPIGSSMTENESDIVYSLSTNTDYYNGTATLRAVADWDTPGYDLMVQLFDSVNKQVIDMGVDFTNFQWFDENEGIFVFNDSNGVPFSGGLSPDSRSVDINGVGLISFQKVQGPVPAVPEPGVIYLVIPGLVGMYFMHRRRNKNTK